MKKLIFATGNEGKMKEIRMILGDLDYEILSMKEAGIDVDIVEDGKTFEENAIIKATEISKIAGCVVLADDSGLEVDAMDKMPGIYSARYLGEDTPYSIKNQTIIDNLAGLPDEKRTARFMCAMALVLPDGRTTGVIGKCEGIITEKVHGNGGFGYDPVFFVEQFGKTFGETTEEEKNSVSHRCNAVKLMKKELSEIFSV